MLGLIPRPEETVECRATDGRLVALVDIVPEDEWQTEVPELAPLARLSLHEAKAQGEQPIQLRENGRYEYSPRPAPAARAARLKLVGNLVRSRKRRETDNDIGRIETGSHCGLLRLEIEEDGRPGEWLDAAIRYQIGTTPILITIECRRRNRKQDDTWIEQLASKRAKIGAAKTIAVCSKGFSESAYKTAKLHNIELRQLSELQSINPDEWFLKGGAVHICREFSEITCAVTLKCSDGRPAGWSAAMKDEFQPVFYHKLIHSPFPAATLLSIVEEVQPEAFDDVPLNGTPKVVTLTVDFSSSTGDARLLVKWIDHNRHDCLTEVSYVRLTVTVAYRTAVRDLDSGVHHVYKGPEGTEIKHSHFDTEWLGLPVRFDHQQDSTGRTSASWEVLKTAQPDPPGSASPPLAPPKSPTSAKPPKAPPPSPPREPNTAPPPPPEKPPFISL